MTSKLELYILANNNAAPFPSEAEQIVLYDFSHTAQRMGEAPEITATIQADGVIENSLSTKVFCEYNGERYYLKSLPSSSKDNTDPRYSFELTFVSERTILDNVYMIDAVQGNSGLDRYQSNSTNVVFMGDINEAVARLNAAMTYTGVGYSVVIDSGISTESKQVSFADKYFTEVLQEYAKTYGIPYYFVGKVAHFGWAQYDVPTVKYLDGLISVSKDNQNNRIINRATATGSGENIPYYYPNPTPRGVITYSVPNGVTVISEHKLALLPVGSSLVYIPETQEIAVKGTYGFLRITDRQPDFSVSDQNATLIIPQYDSSEGQIISGPVALLKNTFPESKNFTTTVVVRHPKGALTPSADNMLPIYPLNAIACSRVDDVLVEDASVIVSVASSNTVASQNYANDEETTFNLNISDFPAGEERYIFLRFLNPSSLRSDSKIFQFSFSVSERGLLQGWHIQDANNAINEAVVNATDYGLRVSDSFTTGTVSYSIVSKIPFATTLMPPIYRESNGEQRFYNATNGEYSGITFENEYSAESRKEGITKFEDIKPTIKGIINAAGYRIDMFSAFAYDLNDNDATILSDGNTEEYQHPYFYAKLRKIDGAYGFNLFDQALESGEMTVSMTSGACGACKFAIMVDKNTQRNLVMVDDDGNLMYDASGNVMMATDARGLDKQNDTINNEVWIALKKDNSTFGQVMPNVEYGHYPSTSDTFVLLHILMPEVYIKNAEERLKSAIIDFLVANNSALFNTAINFSRIYLHDNPDKVAIITENSRIGVEYNGKEHTYFISSVTYRKAKSDILPEISVELTQDIQPTTSNIQAAISAITVTQQQVTEIVDKSEKQPKYLKSDTGDTAQGKITFEKGLDFADNLNSKGFKRGALDGKGFGVYSDSQGKVIVEADKVISRQGGYGGGESGLNNYVTTNTEQVVTAHKDFAAGISMYGIPWEYDIERDAWTIKGNVIITKGLATYSTLKDDDVLSVFDGLPIDNNTLQWQETENGKILVAVGGGSGGGLDESKLQDYLDEKKYVTESWVTGKNYALKTDLDTVSTKLNNFLEGSDTDAIINKWSELEVFLSGLAETDNLAEILSTKFDKANFTKANIKDKLGIADWALSTTNPSYTKAEAINNFVSRTTAQDISVVHNFTNGIKLFGKSPFSYNATKDTWELNGNLVITKGLATYTRLSGFEDLGIMAAIEVDGTTISKDGGVLHFIGETGGLDENALADYLTTNKYATQTWVTNQKYFTQANFTKDKIKETLGISDWALSTTNPSYTKAEADDKYLLKTGTAADSSKLGGTAATYFARWADHVVASSSYKHLGYGYSSDGWYTTGPATVFGVSNYKAALQFRWNDTHFYAGYAYETNELSNWKKLAYITDTVDAAKQLLSNSKSVYYDSAKDAWVVEGNLVVTGGLATYTKLSGFTNLDVMGGIVVDNTTIAIVDGALKYIGETSGGGSISITGAASTIVSSNLTASRALISNSSGKVAVSSITSTKLGYLTDVTSNIQAQLNNKQATLVSGTNIKTINNQSILGSGNISISGGASGDYLPLDGGEISGTVVFSKSLTASFAGAQIQLGPSQKARLSANNDGSLWLFGSKISFYPNASASSANTNQMVLATSGTLTVSGAVTENSDRKLKDIEYEGDGLDLDALKKVKVAKWKWKDQHDKRLHIGGVADNLAEVMPEAVFESQEEDGTTTSSIAYGKAGFSIAASLIAPVARHEDRIKELEKSIEKMQKELNQLRKTA